MTARSTATGTFLAIVFSLGIGAIAGGILAPRPAPESAGAVEADPSVDVQLTSYDDARAVRVKVRWAEGPKVLVPDAGIVTSVDCSPGDEWTSGMVPLTINDRGRVLVHLPRPMWRDFSGGEHGPDVEALQELLADSGRDVGKKGVFDRGTSRAWRDYLRASGVPTTHLEFRLTDIIALPAEGFTVTTCDTRPGMSVTAESTIASGPGELNSVALAATPQNLTPGARLLTVGETSVPTDGSGAPISPEGLAQLGTERTLLATRDLPEETPEALGQFTLAAPLVTAALPPSTLFGISDDTACVTDGERSYSVKIVASSLGLSHVSFQDDPPARVLLNPPKEQVCS